MIWVFVAAVAAILIGVYVIRPRVGPLFGGDFQGVKTEAFVGPIVTLAVFLTAFVVAQALGTYQRTNQAASQEAAAIELMFENAGLLPDEQGRELQASAICYARATANLEFPSLADGERAPALDWWAGEFTEQIPAVLDGPGSVVGQIVSLNRQQTEARANRIFEAQPQLPTLTVALMVIAFLGVVLALSSLAVPDMRQRVLLVLVGLLATLLGGTIFMIEQLEEPFSGFLRIKPTAIENADARMESIFPAGYPLPCDEDGRPIPVVAADVPAGTVAPGEDPLVVCSAVGFRPMNFADPKGQTPSGYAGFDVDLIQYIADRIGRTVQIEEQPLPRLTNAVNVGLCDVIASAFTITPGRAESVDFSVPYFDSDLAVLARVGATPPEAGIAGLRGERIGVQSGSNAQEYIDDNRPPGSTVLNYATSDELLAALRSGEVDVAIKPLPAARFDASQDPGLVVSSALGLEQQFAFAVAKGADPALLDEINAGIEAARADGTLDELQRRYFPPTAP